MMILNSELDINMILPLNIDDSTFFEILNPNGNDRRRFKHVTVDNSEELNV